MVSARPTPIVLNMVSLIASTVRCKPPLLLSSRKKSPLPSAAEFRVLSRDALAHRAEAHLESDQVRCAFHAQRHHLHHITTVVGCRWHFSRFAVISAATPKEPPDAYFRGAAATPPDFARTNAPSCHNKPGAYIIAHAA